MGIGFGAVAAVGGVGRRVAGNMTDSFPTDAFSLSALDLRGTEFS